MSCADFTPPPHPHNFQAFLYCLWTKPPNKGQKNERPVEWESLVVTAAGGLRLSDLDSGVGGFKGGRSTSGATHPSRIPVSSLITTHHFFHLHLFFCTELKWAYHEFNEMKVFKMGEWATLADYRKDDLPPNEPWSPYRKSRGGVECYLMFQTLTLNTTPQWSLNEREWVRLWFFLLHRLSVTVEGTGSHRS